MPVTITIDRPSGPEDVVLNTEIDCGIDDDNIDAELSRMGQILAEYGVHFAELRGQLAIDETAASRMVAYYDLWFRDPANYSGKITEGKIKSLVISQPAVILVGDKVNQTKVHLFKVENLYRSLYQKADCLKALAYKHRVEIKATGF